MLSFNHTSRSHIGSVVHTKCIFVQLPKVNLNFQSWTPGCIMISYHLPNLYVPVTVCLQLGLGGLFTSNPYPILVSLRTVCVYCCHGGGFYSWGRLPGLIVTDRLFSETIPLSPLGSMSRSTSSLLLHPCLRFVGPCLFPIHSCELDISIIMWYQNSVPSIFTQLHIFHVYFW